MPDDDGGQLLDVLVLGPVAVRQGVADLPVGSAKQRTLLARLVVAGGRPLSPPRLCDDLWPYDPPKEPVHALQARVSRLRSAVPLDIRLVNGGYSIDPATFHTDSATFEKLRDEGVWHLADGALSQASERLSQALDLWRGPAFGDTPEVVPLQAESVRLEKLRRSTLEDRIDVDLALGRQEAVIPEVAALVEETPLLERHWGQLMVALYRDGRAQEALDVYARARAAFAELLGVEPSSELGRLHVQILRQEPAECLSRLPMVEPILALSDALRPGTTGGPDTSALTSNDAIDLAELLHQYRAVIITGPAGIGKTHLLRAVRVRFAAQHCLALFLSASKLSQPIPLGVFAGTAGSLAEDRSTPASLIDTFARHRSTTVLLVDNVDALDPASLFVVTQLISTSRVPTVLACRTLTDAPAEIRDLYDQGDVVEVPVGKLDDEASQALATSITGGPLTPDSRVHLLTLGEGNPFRLRELALGSMAEGHLVSTDHGWALRGDLVPSPRLAQVLADRFDGWDQTVLEAVSLVAIAGEYPREALRPVQRRAVARSRAVTLADSGWLRLTDQLDREVLRRRCGPVLWDDLTRDVVRVLRGDVAADVPQAKWRAHLLALDFGGPIDVPATMVLAQQALGAFDERLALRAAEAVIATVPEHVQAHTVAGLASSALGRPREADRFFERAIGFAPSDRETVDVTLARAQHWGVRQYDARAALRLIDEAASAVTTETEVVRLRRARARWAMIVGLGIGPGVEEGQGLDAEAKVADVASLITVGVSAVIRGPLVDAHQALARLRSVSPDLVATFPGGEALVELTRIMAVSNTGDVLTTRRLLHDKIAEARTQAPELLGMWQYALGFSELLSGDVSRAQEYAIAAVEHLRWRDPTGLLPAAQALSVASSYRAGRAAGAQRSFESVPEVAAGDPKVVMLRAWSEAWQARLNGRTEDAASILLDGARWLLTAQHNYFSGMLAHCAVRSGYLYNDAEALLTEAYEVAGGGLLALFLRHAQASAAGDLVALARVARSARELGLVTTAVDTWRWLDRFPSGQRASVRLDRQHSEIDALAGEYPMMALWT